jgi:hypothetical protein
MRKAKLTVDFSEVDGPAWALGATVEVTRVLEGILGTSYIIKAADGSTGLVYPRELEFVGND